MNNPDKFRIGPDGQKILFGYLLAALLFASDIYCPAMVIPAVGVLIATTGYGISVLRKHNNHDRHS